MGHERGLARFPGGPLEDGKRSDPRSTGSSLTSAICARKRFEATAVKRTLRIAGLDVANGREARLQDSAREGPGSAP